MSRVPETDEDVRALFDDYTNPHLRGLLWNIYYCKRQMGQSVLDACHETLIAHIESVAAACEVIAKAGGGR